MMHGLFEVHCDAITLTTCNHLMFVWTGDMNSHPQPCLMYHHHWWAMTFTIWDAYDCDHIYWHLLLFIIYEWLTGDSFAQVTITFIKTSLFPSSRSMILPIRLCIQLWYLLCLVILQDYFIYFYTSHSRSTCFDYLIQQLPLQGYGIYCSWYLWPALRSCWSSICEWQLQQLWSDSISSGMRFEVIKVPLPYIWLNTRSWGSMFDCNKQMLAILIPIIYLRGLRKLHHSCMCSTGCAYACRTHA